MVSRFLLLLILVPIVELSLLFRVAEAINWGPTILLVLGTGMFGVVVARHQGFRVLRGIQEDMAAGRQPTDSVVDGLLILFAGVLLVMPGILTDVCGLALLIPPLRRLTRAWLAARFANRMVVMHHHDATFVDVEATVHDAGTPGAPRRVASRVLGPALPEPAEHDAPPTDRA